MFSFFEYYLKIKNFPYLELKSIYLKVNKEFKKTKSDKIKKNIERLVYLMNLKSLISSTQILTQLKLLPSN